MRIFDFIDDFLNELTMYRLLVYGLLLLAGVAIAYSALGIESTSVAGLLCSLLILVAICYLTNKALAGVWRAVPNQESWLITALILFFIMPPASTILKAVCVATAGFVAIASKYLISYHNKHIFNPAAFGAVVVGLLGLGHAAWWVGNSTLWPYALVLGLLVVRKIRRFNLLVSFVLVSIAATVGLAASQNQELATLLKPTLVASPLIFLGTIMLTEPATMPSRKNQQIIFGGLVGLLYGLHPQVFGQYIYPETALLIGNIYAYAVNPKHTVNLILKQVHVLSERISSYEFVAEQKVTFQPGQYTDWTLPGVAFDSRGNRRTFTIASSPSEDTVMLGVKFYNPSSAYKKRLSSLKPGDRMVAGQIAGNFTLPSDASQKLVFIAGGIGITPFRSMLKYLLDEDQQRDIVLFYLVSDPHELSYRDILQQSITAGVRVVPVLTSNAEGAWKGLRGPLTEEMIQQYVSDLGERRVYISGPNALVTSYQRMIRHLGVRPGNIVTDHFSGY